MARMLHPDRDEPPRGCGCRWWSVAGERHDNTAAKFWSALLDEVAADYPPATALALSGATDGLLAPDALDPAIALRRELSRAGRGDIRRAMRDTLAVLAITGPPPPVRVRLLQPGRRRPLLSRRLDDVDGDLLPFLFGWILCWCGVPPGRWNEDEVEGAFAAEDPGRSRRYDVRVLLTNRHLREGLFERGITLHATVQLSGGT